MSDSLPLKMIQAEIASGKATVRSLGVLYMVAMANHGAAGGIPHEPFPAINRAIVDHLGGDTPAKRMMRLDRVKQVGWSLYEAIAADEAKAAREREDRRIVEGAAAWLFG